jgi:NADP-dependent 3-hydroxy acid dehydrogenase YdfG
MKALLTGAGSGVGRAVADVLHARGDHLVLLARNERRAEDLRQRYAGAEVRVADLAQAASVAPAVAGLERLDALVHAAGVIELAGIADVRLADLESQLTVNLVSPTEMTRALLPALRATRGQVLFLNSSAGLVANAGWGAYAASKFGLKAIADALRAEEADAGVRVTSVYLGRVSTPMQAKVRQQEGKPYDPSDWASPESAAATILHVLDLPADSTVPDIRFRPAPQP